MSRPTTLDEAMQALMETLSVENQVELTRMKEEDLIRTHHGLGRWIRNNWGLWEDSELFWHMQSLGFTHPDDMSSSIIHEFWSRMNNLPSKLQEQIARYKEYWSKKDNQ